MITDLNRYGIKKKRALELYEKHGYQIVTETSAYVGKQDAMGKAKDPAGLLIFLLEQGGAKLPKVEEVKPLYMRSQGYVGPEGHYIYGKKVLEDV